MAIAGEERREQSNRVELEGINWRKKDWEVVRRKDRVTQQGAVSEGKQKVSFYTAAFLQYFCLLCKQISISNWEKKTSKYSFKIRILVSVSKIYFIMIYFV